ncbi:MAG: M48 family metallopeptidase [Selenomonadaceae bacterium]|nr:M48 family metallopeptidase [Selenomonadaceae bacterium]
MKILSLAKKVAATVSAAAVIFAVSSPKTEAANIWGTLIGGAVYSAQLDSEIRAINNDEKGRQQFFEAMKQKYGVNNDPNLNNRLDTIMYNLTEAIGKVDSSINDKPYNYFINKDTSFNAFCTLGHNISVNTVLFNHLESDDEIAVVLAHEMGHGQKDHPAKGARKSILPMIVASTVNNIGGVILANALNNQGITKPMEREADALAFEYITHSNYNPGACAAVWQRVIDQSGDNPDTFVTFLAGGSDHPSHASRRDTYAKKLREYSKDNVEVKEGVVKIKGKDFAVIAPTNSMSAKERAFFVAGNLAAAYKNGHNKKEVTAQNGVIYMGPQPIMTVLDGDENIDVLTERLNSIK